jgi:rRNA-processing protein FCF1
VPGRRKRAVRSGRTVLLDTNAALLPFRSGTDVAGEVARLLPAARLAVPDAVRAEVDRLVARKVAFAEAARALIERWPTVPTFGRGDSAVYRAALGLGAAVVTADRAFADRLRAAGVDTLVPRDRQRLELRRGAPQRPLEELRLGGGRGKG